MPNCPIPGPGRNTKLTPELQDLFCAKLRKTLPVDKCCDLIGLGIQTYYDWMDRGEKAAAGDEIYVSFSEAVKQARAEAQEFWIDVMQNSAVDKGTNPKAAFWVLERSDRKNWGRVAHHQVDHMIVTPDSLANTLKAIEQDQDDGDEDD